MLVGTNEQIVVHVHADGRRVKCVDYNLRRRSRNQSPLLRGRGCVGRICHTSSFSMGVVGDRPFNEVDTRGFRTELKLVLIFSYAQKFETSPSEGRTVTKTVQYRVRNPGTAIFLRTWLVQKRLRRLERLRLPLSSYRVKAPPLSQTTRPFISIFSMASPDADSRILRFFSGRSRESSSRPLRPAARTYRGAPF